MMNQIFFPEDNGERRGHNAGRRREDRRVTARGTAWTGAVGTQGLPIDNPHRARRGRCPSCGQDVADVRTIGKWSGGNPGGEVTSGIIYAAECNACSAVLTTSAPSDRGHHELEWRIER